MSQSNSAKRPLTTLQKNTKKKVTVRLKSEIEYKGKMDNVDSYMNLIMTDAEEIHEGRTIANYGRVIVRGNNVLFSGDNGDHRLCGGGRRGHVKGSA